jgi:hypothetical protein
MRRVFYCLQFGATAAGHKPIKRAQALLIPAPLPTYCPPCNRGLWAILSARGPYRPPCAQAYARAHAPACARVHAPARMTRPLPFCFNSCRQTLPFFAGKRINFCRQTLSFFLFDQNHFGWRVLLNHAPQIGFTIVGQFRRAEHVFFCVKVAGLEPSLVDPSRFFERV